MTESNLLNLDKKLSIILTKPTLPSKGQASKDQARLDNPLKLGGIGQL